MNKFSLFFLLVFFISDFGLNPAFSQSSALAQSAAVELKPKIKVTILSAVALDKDANCGDRSSFEFFSKVDINGKGKRSLISKGSQINPNWEFEGNQKENGNNQIQIWIFDQDKMGCGNHDDVVDITPKGIESGLLLNIDLKSGRIYQRVEKAIPGAPLKVTESALKLGIFGFEYRKRANNDFIKEELILLGKLNETIESIGGEEQYGFFAQRGSIKFKVELLKA